MLSAQWLNSASENTTAPAVVFLHGLLGDRSDWQALFAHLQKNTQIRPLAIDLPFHGESQQIACTGFASVRQLIHQTIQHHIGEQPFWLVGYSLGGRLALDYALNANNPNLQGAILEGANVGLESETERQARWQNDHRWAERFRHEPTAAVLKDWYQQPVFADLDDNKRSILIEKRQTNAGEHIAQMLEATSLAKQPFFRIPPENDIVFLIGERDSKFHQMAEKYQLNYQLIADAGHNVHRENAPAVADFLCKKIRVR